ncbi:hypothetical protein D3C81_1541220 [compost metagenome]
MEAQPVEVGAEARLGAGHAEVGRQCQAKPGADGGAFHRGDDGFAVAVELHRMHIEARGVVGDLSLAGAAEVGARTEGADPGGQHDGAAARVVVQRQQGVREPAHHLGIDKVVRRTGQHDAGDMAVAAELDIGVG